MSVWTLPTGRDKHLALEISIKHKLFTVHSPAPGQEAGEQGKEKEKKKECRICFPEGVF